MENLKKSPISLEKFEKIIYENLSPTIKKLLKSPHRYYLTFNTPCQNSGYSEYSLEIFRVKKLPVSCDLSYADRLKYIAKEEKTDNVLIKCLSCKYPKHRSIPMRTGYHSNIFKDRVTNGYYFCGTALYWTFNFCNDDLTEENAIKIGQSIYIDY